MQLLNAYGSIIIDRIYQTIIETAIKYGLNSLSQQVERPKQIDKLYCCIISFINILITQQIRNVILCLLYVLIPELLFKMKKVIVQSSIILTTTYKASDSMHLNIKATDTFEFRIKQDVIHILKLFKVVVGNQQLVLHQEHLIIQPVVLFIVVLTDVLSDIQVLILSTLIEYQNLSLKPQNSNVIAIEYTLTFINSSVGTGLFESIVLAPNVKVLQQYKVFFVDTIQCQIIEQLFKIQREPKQSNESQSEILSIFVIIYDIHVVAVVLLLGLHTKQETSEKFSFFSIKTYILFVVLTGIEQPINVVVDISSQEKENLCNVSDSKNILIGYSTNAVNTTYTAPELTVLLVEQQCGVIQC